MIYHVTAQATHMKRAMIGVGLLALFSLLSSAAFAATKARDLHGVWWIENFDPQLLPADGSAIPFTAQGLAQYQKNKAGLASGEVKDTAITRCLPEALPRAMSSAYPFQIVEHGDLVTFIHEANHAFWSVVLNGTHPGEDDVEPSFMGGSSIGRWQGDTLVIDTLGFKPNSFLDLSGIPHGDQLHVVTRLRTLHAGKQLEAIMTLEDAEFFSTPWTVKRTYERRPDVQLMEFVCGESHRYLPGERSKGVILNWSAK